MENQESDNPRKRKTLAVSELEGKEVVVVDAAGLQGVEMDEAEVEETAESEEMKQELSCIIEKIESFTQLVSELLESAKKLFKDLSDEFEDRVIMIHKEKMEKWQVEMGDLRLLDASNEEIKALVQKAQYLLNSFHGDT